MVLHSEEEQRNRQSIAGQNRASRTHMSARLHHMKNYGQKMGLEVCIDTVLLDVSCKLLVFRMVLLTQAYHVLMKN